MNILTINEGFSDNLGDQAIQYTLRRCLEELGAKVDFEDYSGSVAPIDGVYRYAKSAHKRRNFRSYLPISSSIKFKVKYILWWYQNRKRIKSALSKKEYDHVILGGGQMLQSNGVFPQMVDFWTKCIKKYTNAKVLFFGVGIGANLKRSDIQMLKRSLERADAIYVRDNYSKYIGERILGHEINYVPDVAFTIDNFIPNNIINKSKRVLVGIPAQSHLLSKSKWRGDDGRSTNIPIWNFEGNDNMQKVYDWWSNQILKFIIDGYDVELFYTTIADYLEANNFKDYFFRKSNHDLKILNYSSLVEFIEEIKNSEIIVSGRMHALIIGFVYGCKLVPFNFSQKIQSFNDEYLEKKQDIQAIQSEIKLKLSKEVCNIFID